MTKNFGASQCIRPGLILTLRQSFAKIGIRFTRLEDTDLNPFRPMVVDVTSASGHHYTACFTFWPQAADVNWVSNIVKHYNPEGLSRATPLEKKAGGIIFLTISLTQV